MAVKLHFTRSGTGPPVVLLHGLFGAGGNLGALVGALQDSFEVYSVDLPNHGRSGWLERADLPAMMQCLRHWMDEQQLSCASFVGHSLGGKVAMQLALQYSSRVAALIVADIAPVVYPPHHDAVFTALDAVVAGQCTSRQQATELMAVHIAEQGVIQFLLMSLQRGAGGIYCWRFNLEGIKAGYQAVRAAPLAEHAYRGPVLFIKGGESNYILEEHREDILGLFPRAKVKTMPGCGHWLHAQQPRLFNSIVSRFLQAAIIQV
ncbi:MAG: alpha/beta hydrolase [Gammaproteobacteria bacterium]|nr:MAG: alpha/beta hydrolase [Gammaproteobacteria bacterium]RLA60098.1 MAG: alpha/beta hydrolase [Gammaproteobacteria bacterium]